MEENDTKYLSQLEVADSKFYGYVVKDVEKKEDAEKIHQKIKSLFPDAAHIPYCWISSNDNDSDHHDGYYYEDDGEPENSAGKILYDVMKSKLVSCSCDMSILVYVVRYFGEQLLGVTCGRLPQCYGNACEIALFHFFQQELKKSSDFPMVIEYNLNIDNDSNDVISKVVDINQSYGIYGLAAGDSELIFNIVPSSDKLSKLSPLDFINKLTEELEFDGFKGSKDETLPRLQNLQADMSCDFFPVYRYPGNYSGDEWETYSWSPTSIQIRDYVEKALLGEEKQKMNHCVTNLYRDGNDFIAHHSDKDLDLDQSGYIVSVSVGDERIMELRQRKHPQNVTRILLPHNSMFVLGPVTNKYYTHSILQKFDEKKGETEEKSIPRISLTFRNVTTFMHKKTGLLYGQGVPTKSSKALVEAEDTQHKLFIFGFSILSGLLLSKQQKSKCSILPVIGLVAAYGFSSYSFQKLKLKLYKQREEKNARLFFSKKSASGNKY